MMRPRYYSELEAQINRISDDSLRAFAFYAVDRAPGSFWLAPASSSGKYHPADERGPGGTVLHTARVMELCYDLAVMEDLPEFQRDELLFAALLHDMWKGGEGDESIGYTWPLHQVAPRVHVSRWFKEWAGSLTRVTEDKLDRIFRAIEAHEGCWSILAAAKNDHLYGGRLGNLLHIADYIASRSHVSIDVASDLAKPGSDGDGANANS